MTIASNVNQCLATIKGIEAQLSILALNSINADAKQAFHEVMLMVSEIKDDIQARVKVIELEEPQYKNS